VAIPLLMLHHNRRNMSLNTKLNTLLPPTHLSTFPNMLRSMLLSTPPSMRRSTRLNIPSTLLNTHPSMLPSSI